MIFISGETRLSVVFFRRLVTTTVGDPMNTPGKLIASALLSVGIAAAAMAADMPKSAAPMAADAPAAGSTTAAPAKSSKSGKHSKKSKKSTPAPSASK
jgi:hypothetical protein